MAWGRNASIVDVYLTSQAARDMLIFQKKGIKHQSLTNITWRLRLLN